MTQPHDFQYFLPFLTIAILAPVLYMRMRRLMQAQPLKLTRLWIRPATFIAIAGLVVLVPAQNHGAHRLAAHDGLWLGLAACLGAVSGWYWGRTMAIDVHPEDGTLMVRGGQGAMLVLVVLILIRLGLRTGLSIQAKAWHLDMVLFANASIVFSALLFTMRSVEMYIRARRVLARQAGS